MKIHVHVYKVTLKAEIDFDEDEFGSMSSMEDAESTALKLAESGALKFGESDCRFIALGFKVPK